MITQLCFCTSRSNLYFLIRLIYNSNRVILNWWYLTTCYPIMVPKSFEMDRSWIFIFILLQVFQIINYTFPVVRSTHEVPSQLVTFKYLQRQFSIYYHFIIWRKRFLVCFLLQQLSFLYGIPLGNAAVTKISVHPVLFYILGISTFCTILLRLSRLMIFVSLKNQYVIWDRVHVVIIEFLDYNCVYRT